MLNLRVVIDRNGARQAYQALRHQLSQGSTHHEVRLGYRGGQKQAVVAWHRQYAFWSFLPPSPKMNRYLCWYGVEDPAAVKEPRTLAITCEINPPQQGYNRRLGGVFLSDPKGDAYLGHTGQLGGSGEGISKSPFFDWLGPGRLGAVTWPDGKETQAVVLGAIASSRFLPRLAEYIRVVRSFKDRETAMLSPVSLGQRSGFSPEFEGRRRPYQHSDPIESWCDHGLVVNALARRLKEEGLTVASDQQRDLCVLSPSRQIRALFEVKTSIDPQSLYTGLGQLMFHGMAHQPEPRRILVLPQKPSRSTASVLQKLGVGVQLFELNGTAATFPRLEFFLREQNLSKP